MFVCGEGGGQGSRVVQRPHFAEELRVKVTSAFALEAREAGLRQGESGLS